MPDNLFHYAPPRPDFEQWLAIARRATAGGYTRDAILGGLRARLFTNHLPLADAWSDNFFGPQEWQHLVRQALPPDAVMSLYAAVTKDHEPLSAVNPATSTAVMINRTDDDALLDTVVVLAAHKLGEQAAWLARGMCVTVGTRSLIVTGPNHASVAADIAAKARGQIAIHDPLLARITLTRQVDGVQLAPTRILTERGREITGAHILHWLRRDAYQEPRADVFCLTLDQRDEPVMARDLDLDRSAELYLYPLTRTSPRPAEPPLLTDVVGLVSGSQLAVLSVDAKTFVTRLMADQPWTQADVVQEVVRAVECHLAGVTSPADEQLRIFITDLARRLKETRR
jgi:hypothetical protein